jgi:hypothetical protein
MRELSSDGYSKPAVPHIQCHMHHRFGSRNGPGMFRISRLGVVHARVLRTKLYDAKSRYGNVP